jgi:ABC-type dipeptide/oligopeptide/nickel transport system ATPase component
MSALADNICHVSKEDDKIPRLDEMRADVVPNREVKVVGCRFNARCHPDSARFSSRAEEPALSEAEGISV